MNTTSKIITKLRQRIQPIANFFVEFCDNSNIHGVRYLTEKLLHWSERLWWIIALSVSLWFCGSAAHNIWIEWRDNPMTLSFSEAPASIWEIPYPTLTICPESKTRKVILDLEAALKSLSNLTEFERMSLNALAHINSRVHKFLKDKAKDNFANESIYETMQQIGFKKDAVILHALFPGYFKYGRFSTVFTEDGVCFAYNTLNSRDIYTDEMAPQMMIVEDNANAANWSLEKDFLDKSMKARYPIHEESGPETYLFTFEKVMKKLKQNDQGYKVVLSVPGDTVKISENPLQVPLNADTNILIIPKLTITSEGLRKYSPHQRQCFFASERRLRFFRIYSQSNCEAECLANYTNSECGCVKFSQPRDRDTKLCGVAKINCYKSAEVKLSREDSDSSKLFRDECNCLPACTSLEYETEMERISLHVEQNIESIRPLILRANLRGDQVKTVKRIESNTFSDFLAFCGGLLGIFLGVSALSIVEIIYYSTLRLYFIIRPMGVSNAVIPFHEEHSNFFERFRFIRGIWSFIVEFCDNSSIHGLAYFTRRGLHWTERLWWIISFGLSIWLCTAMTMNVWQVWQENPVKIISNERIISDIPFPTVTICPQIKNLRNKIDLSIIMKELENVSDERFLQEHKEIWPLIHVCPSLEYFKPFKTYEGGDIFEKLQEYAPQLKDVMYKCIWQGKVVDCLAYMAPIFNERGFCFTFNALNSHEIYTDEMAPGLMITKNNSNLTNWSLEDGYKNETTVKVYPRRAHESGQGTALEISLDIHQRDIEYFCNPLEFGFHVMIGVPGDESELYESFFRVPLLDESVITLKPKLTTTSEGLRKYNPNHRKCYFESERKLRFYKIYSKTNCEMECLANLTKIKCECVRFSHPRDRDTPICGAGKIECYQTVDIDLRHYLAPDKKFERKHFEACNCLPSCTTIDYNPAIDSTQFNESAIAVTAGRNANMSGILRAKLVIYFENRVIETEHRVELYTIIDLVAICGGLLGLFMGISVLSIAEILYYSTLRWYWILRRQAAERD